MLNLSTLLAAATFSLVSLVLPNHNPISTKNMKAVQDDDSLTITSTAFKAGGMIPKKYCCGGSNFNPPLHIAGIPAEAKSVTIIVDDPDAPVDGGFTHWLAWNLDQTMVDIKENYTGGTQGMNMAKKKGYTGPCPPQGTHHYHFRVYALDTRLKVPADATKEKILSAMEGHILKAGDLVGLYSKGK